MHSSKFLMGFLEIKTAFHKWKKFITSFTNPVILGIKTAKIGDLE